MPVQDSPNDEPDSLRLVQLWDALMRLKPGVKVKLFLGLATTIIAYSTFLYNLGTKEEASQIAISLESPFDLSVTPREDNTTTQSLNNVFFRPPYDYPKQEDRVTLQLIQVNDKAETNPIGSAKVQKPQLTTNPILAFLSSTLDVLKNIISLTAIAQEAFDWRGHQQHRDFYEKYHAPQVIWRYYSDGSILEYRVDDHEVMVSSTLRWVKT